ncbi:hypothetical protein BDV98DRAFT_541158 [Pterulicium gracile]|uniref:Pentacotripeptide-repeat region of PRORP domain-containing protein n=1 Tax=Pterulicium gracile TaxID=1884261 RepID=A0A5C3QXK8_9AGAR|nr:hypothetical protein BDV98DRAFT_541158 [Pterula gracilis]
MGHTPDGKKTYKDFVHKVIFARLAKYPGLVTSRIASLARAEHVQQLVALYNGMKEGLFGPTIFVALDEKSVSPQRPVLIPPFIWAAFIEAFIKCKVPHHAEELWDDMNRLGVQPPASAWTALINGYGNHRGIAKAYSAWVTMQKLKVKPEPSTYRAIIHALFVDKQDAEAMKLFREFQKEFSGRTDAPGAVAVYNAVVHLLHLMHSDEATAEGILDHMRTHGPKPDLSTYNVFISYHGRRGNFSKLAALTKEMESNDIKPSEFTYSSLLSALLRAGRSNAADMVLNLMLKNGIKPTVAIYTTLMHFQLQEETIHGLNGALALLQKMETDKDPSVRPNVVTYTTLLAAIHKGTWLTADLREEKTSQILQNMSQRGIGFHRITYHILIPACLDNPTEDGLETGMRYYRAMIESGIQVVNDTWYVILRKLHYRRNWEEAEEVVKDMSATFGDKLPPKWLADLVGKIRGRVIRRQHY